MLTAHHNSHADLADFSYHILDPANSTSPSPGCSANPLHGVSCTDPCASCHSANPSKFGVALIKAEPGIYLRGAPSAISMAVIPKDHKSLCKTKQRETRHAVEHCHDREHQVSPRAQPHALGLCFLCQPPDPQHRSSSFMLCPFVRALEETPSPADYSKVYFNAFTEFLVDDKANPCSHFVGHCSQWTWWGCCLGRHQHPKCPLFVAPQRMKPQIPSEPATNHLPASWMEKVARGERGDQLQVAPLLGSAHWAPRLLLPVAMGCKW